MMQTKDVFYCLFSAIAIIISLFSLFKNKKIAEKNLNKEFFKDIYFEYIILKLPDKLSKIQYGSMLFKTCNDVDKIVISLLDRSQFYKYFDESFYNNISESLIDLDEKLIKMKSAKADNYILDKYKKQVINLTNEVYKKLKKYYSKI